MSHNLTVNVYTYIHTCIQAYQPINILKSIVEFNLLILVTRTLTKKSYLLQNILAHDQMSAELCHIEEWSRCYHYQSVKGGQIL